MGGPSRKVLLQEGLKNAEPNISMILFAEFVKLGAHYVNKKISLIFPYSGQSQCTGTIFKMVVLLLMLNVLSPRHAIPNVIL